MNKLKLLKRSPGLQRTVSLGFHSLFSLGRLTARPHLHPDCILSDEGFTEANDWLPSVAYLSLLLLKVNEQTHLYSGESEGSVGCFIVTEP